MDMDEKLPAAAYKPGMVVVGCDEGGPALGVVSQGHPHRLADDEEVLVRWIEEVYEAPTDGHFAPADTLQVWPARAHAAALANHRGGA